MAITYSTELEIYRSTETSARTKIASWVEPSVGNEEAVYTVRINPSSTVSIPMPTITQGVFVMFDAKPQGGTTDVNMVVQIINTAITGVASGSQDIRFGSKFILCDGNFTSVSLKNLDTLSYVDVQVKIIGN